MNLPFRPHTHKHTSTYNSVLDFANVKAWNVQLYILLLVIRKLKKQTRAFALGGPQNVPLK